LTNKKRGHGEREREGKKTERWFCRRCSMQHVACGGSLLIGVLGRATSLARARFLPNTRTRCRGVACESVIRLVAAARLPPSQPVLYCLVFPAGSPSPRAGALRCDAIAMRCTLQASLSAFDADLVQSADMQALEKSMPLPPLGEHVTYLQNALVSSFLMRTRTVCADAWRVLCWVGCS